MKTAEGKLRVLHLITDLGKGGAERFLLDLCRALKGRPEIELMIGTLFDANEYEASSAGLPIVRLNYETFSFRKKTDYPEYRSLLSEFRPHVVHTHRFLAEFLSAFHASPDVLYVCHGHDNMVQFRKFKAGALLHREALTNWLEKRYLIRNKYARVRTEFVANSSHTRDFYRTALPAFLRDHVHLVPMGFDFERFRGPESRAPREGETIRLVNVGSFQDKKNQIFIVDIARQMRAVGMDFEIHLLGDGANRERVQAAIDENALQDRITIHGNVERVEDWLQRSDIYLHTAWYEPFGLALLEAMAAGLPCVVLDGKGNRDLIREGQNGFLMEKEDPHAFVDRIAYLMDTPEAYESMSSFARVFASGYDIGEAALRFLDFYQRMLGQAVGDGAPS